MQNIQNICAQSLQYFLNAKSCRFLSCSKNFYVSFWVVCNFLLSKTLFILTTSLCAKNTIHQSAFYAFSERKLFMSCMIMIICIQIAREMSQAQQRLVRFPDMKLFQNAFLLSSRLLWGSAFVKSCWDLNPVYLWTRRYLFEVASRNLGTNVTKHYGLALPSCIKLLSEKRFLCSDAAILQTVFIHACFCLQNEPIFRPSWKRPFSGLSVLIWILSVPQMMQTTSYKTLNIDDLCIFGKMYGTFSSKNPARWRFHQLFSYATVCKRFLFLNKNISIFIAAEISLSRL